MLATADTYVVQLVNEAAVGLANGKKAKAVVEGLVARGVHPSNAEYIVSEADKMKRAAFRKGGVKILIAGIGYLVLGAIITGLALSLSSSFGGFFIVTTGVFLCGIVNVFRGLGRMITG